MRRERMVLSAGLLTLLGLAAFFAPWIAPYPAQAEMRGHSYHPPSRIHFFDHEGRFSLRPFIYRTVSSFDEFHRRIYREDFSEKFFLTFGKDRMVSVNAPARFYLMGTDFRGRDLFSRILYGARISLSAGILGALLACFFGLAAGSLAGYFGGKTDEVLMRLAEFFMMVPAFYFLLALRGSLSPELGSVKVYFLIVVTLSSIGWGGIARVIRGMTLAVCRNEFILAARGLGRSHSHIILRHVVPHTLSYSLVVFSLSVPGYILMESALSVLGLGIQEPEVSWGNLLTEAVSIAHLELRPWVLFPGFFIFLTAFSFNMLGDAFREGLEKT